MTEASAPRHTWSDDIKRIAAIDTGSGNGETIRMCTKCPLVMVTVHPPTGFPWHEFTMPGQTERIKLDHRPPCRSEPVEVKST